ncbi:MAG: PQQ-binding-like beta-propeller repeat protein [Pirellulales bacterium]|nr:PQQ-binding-like beta-propeller repeat protein [Pirellulales bacterium]
MMRRLPTAFLALAFLVFFLSTLHAEDWPRFRGPNGTGVSHTAGLPTQFGPETNVAWKVAAGEGTSSPVIADGRLFFTSFDADTRTVHCLDAATGDTLWTASVEKVRDENASRPNGPATCTPVADAAGVVAFFPDAGLFSFSVSGARRWCADVGPFYSMHGIAASPILAADKVVLLADQLQGSHLAAYDLTSGKPAWKVPRVDGLTGAYSTPSVFQPQGGSAHIVAGGPGELSGYDAATGEKVWSVLGVTNSPVCVPILSGNRLFSCEPVGAISPISMLASLDENRDGRFSLEEVKGSVPIFRLLSLVDKQWGNDDGVVEASEWNAAFGGRVNKGGLVAVDLEDADGAVKTRQRWNYRKTVPYVSSPVVLEDVLYFVQDGGIVTSVDAENGEVLKRGRLKQGGKQFYASPVAADGKVFLVDTAGRMTVLRAGGHWEPLATNLLDEPCVATPALYRGHIYVRTSRTLYCFGEPAGRDVKK